MHRLHLLNALCDGEHLRHHLLRLRVGLDLDDRHSHELIINYLLLERILSNHWRRLINRCLNRCNLLRLEVGRQWQNLWKWELLLLVLLNSHLHCLWLGDSDRLHLGSYSADELWRARSLGEILQQLLLN